MATYNRLIRYLLQIEREAAMFLRLKRIATWAFAIALLFLLVALILNLFPDKAPFFINAKRLLGLAGITGSTLASSLYAEVKADELNRRRIRILNQMRWLGKKQIPASFYEDFLYDSFKDALK